MRGYAGRTRRNGYKILLYLVLSQMDPSAFEPVSPHRYSDAPVSARAAGTSPSALAVSLYIVNRISGIDTKLAAKDSRTAFQRPTY